MKKNLALLLVALLVAIGLSELVARVWFSRGGNEHAVMSVTDKRTEPYETPGEFSGTYDRFAMMTYSPYLSYTPVPNWHGNGYATNAQGLRDERDLAQIHKGLVIVTGGSTAWGAGVSQKQLYSRVAEDMLNKEYKHDLAIVSAGVGAYSSAQELSLVLNRIVKFRPKLVIMLSGWNDTLQGYLGYSQDDGNDYLNFKEVIRRGSADNCDPVKSHVCIAEPAPAPSCEGADALGVLAASVCQVAERARIQLRMRRPEEVVDDFVRNVQVIADLGRREGFDVMVALQPTLYDTKKPLTVFEHRLREGYEKTYMEFPQYNARIYAIYRRMLPVEAARADFKFVDMDESINREKLTVFSDHVHFGDRGNRLMGQYLAMQIAQWSSAKSAK
ncbi:MAG: SGNH/GDSL hydrolase family protein [Betaproteobacteria bacterium]|nr:SGNH/GDSL hydrolase family protein [Betaproteobacteria bacterium]